ncbi:MAG: tetratricopeptide repeat protein [Desulfovibrio sp.]|nr:tetratricopeptide repeat protein [Desulfovibrio sp.]
MTSETLTNISLLLKNRDWAEAEKALDAIDGAALSDRERIVYYDQRAALLRATRRLPEAEELCHTALSLAETIFDADDVRLARVLHNYSMTLDMEQKYEEAIPLAERELAILRKRLPPDSLEITDSVVALAKHHYELGRFTLAREMLEEAIKNYTEKGGRESIGVATCLNNLGRILENKGYNEEAVPLFEEASALREKLQGAHPDTAFTLLNYGTCLAGVGRYKDASQVLIKCRDMYLELGMDDSPYLQAARDNLMLCFNAVMVPC